MHLDAIRRVLTPDGSIGTRRVWRYTAFRGSSVQPTQITRVTPCAQTLTIRTRCGILQHRYESLQFAKCEMPESANKSKEAPDKEASKPPLLRPARAELVW